jgi:hypothetical protein
MWKVRIEESIALLLSTWSKHSRLVSLYLEAGIFKRFIEMSTGSPHYHVQFCGAMVTQLTNR